MRQMNESLHEALRIPPPLMGRTHLTILCSSNIYQSLPPAGMLDEAVSLLRGEPELWAFLPFGPHSI